MIKTISSRGVNGSDIIRFRPDPNPKNYLNYLIRIRICIRIRKIITDKDTVRLLTIRIRLFTLLNHNKCDICS